MACLGTTPEIISDVNYQRAAAWTSLTSDREDLACFRNTRIQFTHGDATVIDWLDADVVFMNSTCFEDGLFNSLEARAVDLKPGTFIITTSRQ